ncbi:MAG: hypothetical protein K0R26_1987 [Bacteroidota bacterium]|jgi:hypothetical protein|nr:hypothetical protein [Bacteroidota bacterium]
MIKSRVKLLSFCLIFLMLISIKTKSQTTVTIGDINTTMYSERYPFNGYYNYSWSNMLYLNSEAGSAGQITKVSFYVVNTPSNYTMNNQLIYVRNTSATSFTNANYPGTSGFTQVFNGTITYNGGGWKTITLSTPFSYDGTSNLEFLFENRDATYATGFPYFAYTTSTGSNRMRRDYNDPSFPTSCANCLALNSILNIQLTKQCASNMTLTASSASVCSGTSATLSASGASAYTWLPSASLNASNDASVIATPTASTIYTITGLDANSCSQTKTLSLTVLALPNLTITPNTPSVCIGSSTTLTATGATNYTWSPSTGLNSTTSSSVIANPTVTTTYSITGSNSNNCINTKTVAVTVYSVPVLNISPGSTTICNGGVASLTASGASAYTWTPSSGLSSTNSSTVNANPSSTTIYTIIGTSNGCSGMITSTVSVSNINAGTAITTGSGNICNNSQVTLSLDSKQAVAIGTGTLNIEKYPFNGYYNYSWSDAIYTQSDIGASGNISKISFYVDNAPSNYVMNNQLIYIRNTSASSFTNSNYPGTSGFTQVFSGSITYNGSGWKEITFTTPYSYNGTDNLEFLFENRDATYATGFPTFRYSVVSSSRVKRDYQDASFPSACVNCATFSNTPNVKFTIDRALSTFVKWQYSYDDNTYNDLTGGTSSSYSTQVNTSTYFRAQSTNGSCAAISSSVFYQTNNNYYVNDNSTMGDIYTSAIGNSSNDGRSPSKPKSSISDVLATYSLTSCDTIYVDKGSYTEEVNITSADAGNGNGYMVIEGAGIDVSILNAPASKNNIFINQANKVKIEKFTMNSTQSTYNNIKIQQANANIVSNNKLVHSTSSNIYMVGTSIRANRNEFLNNQINNSSTSGYGVAVVGNCDSLAIRGNTITNTGSLAGILISSTKISNDIYYPAFGAIDQNTITAQNYGVILSGPDFPIASYTISSNNIEITSNSLTDGAAIWLGSVGNSSAEQSLIFNNRLAGGKNGIYLSSGVNYEKIYNNYVSNNSYGLYVSSSTSSIGELYFNSFYNSTGNVYFVSSASAYWKIKNNILYNSNNTASNACLKVANAMTFVACNNNLYYASNGASVGSFNGINYSTLTNWQAIDHADETPKGDENSIYGNPLYINFSQNNLDVTASSPAAASGVSISGITSDIYNTMRLNPPFIGAEEFLFSVAICNTQTITCSISTATLTGTTASSNISYNWTGPSSGTPAGTSPTSSLTIVSAVGVYTLVATNSNNVSITATIQVVADNTLPNVNAGAGQIITSSMPTATLSGSSTTAGVTYSWTPGGSTPTNSTTVVSSTGVYTLSATNPTNGCVASSTVLVANKMSATATISDYENESIKGKAILNITAGIPPYNIAWNGVKIPLPSVAYSLLKDSLSGVAMDSIQFIHFIDSLRQRTVFDGLQPSTNSAVIYDQTNDSVILSISVGSKINAWAFAQGVTTSTNTINSITVGNINYFYGKGTSITQEGIFSNGNHKAIPSTVINLATTNEISFVMPDNTVTSDAGIFEQAFALSVDTPDVSNKTLFRFNGNGTYDVIVQNSSIFNSTFLSGDYFSLRTNFVAGKITYYKNEVEVTQANISSLNATTGFMAKLVMRSAGGTMSGLKVKLPVVIGPPPPPFNKCLIYSLLYPIVASASPNPICAGLNISLTGQIIGNITPSYEWVPGNLPGQAPPAFPIFSSQIYTLNVTINGCTLKKPVPVVVLPVPAVTISANMNPICLGSGVILSSPVITGATYKWFLAASPIIGATTEVYNPLAAGNYYLQVVNSSGCSSNSNILTVLESPIVNVTAPITNICAGSDVLLTANVTPATGNSYEWHYNSGPIGTNISTHSAGLAGTYDVKVTNTNLCSSTSNVITINVSSGLIANAGPDQIFTSGSVSLGGVPAASGGVPSYNYQWLPNTGFLTGNSNTIPNPDVAPIGSTTYTLTVTDGNLCTGTDEVLITNATGIISFAVPSKIIGAGYYNAISNRVYFMFEEEYRTSILNYTIYDYNVTTLGNPVNQLTCGLYNASTGIVNNAKSIGDNRYYIDITSCGTLVSSKYYLLEIVNDKKEKFYLKFKI